MFSVVHPLLMAGLAAVAVPLLIHLLLRQRPVPRPWAAMRWLQAAAQQAARRWKLTNLLLLLLRMLLVALIALAVARPMLSLVGASAGGRLVIVLDRSASMGARGDAAGALATAVSALPADLPYAKVSLVAVDLAANDGVEVVSDGNATEARAALARQRASMLPGGLDRVAGGPGLDRLLRVVALDRPDVLLISDFQQDAGAALSAALAARCRELRRWSPLPPAAPEANATVIAPAATPDLLPGQGGTLAVRIAGRATAVSLGLDDSPPVTVPAVGLDAPADAAGQRTITVPLPPLPAGDHVARVRLSDHGLVADDLLELPLTVRSAVPALVVGGSVNGDYLAAALASDERAMRSRRVPLTAFAAEPLLAGSLVAVRDTLPAAADSARVATWVREGGVLWTSRRVLGDDPVLAGLIGGQGALHSDGERTGGRWTTGEDRDLDGLLALGVRATVPQVALPAGTSVALSAGDAPAVVVIPAGRGVVVLELVDLAADREWQARGATPLWALRTARRATARAAAVPTLVSGGAAAEDGTLTRGSDSVAIHRGAAVAAEPGAWTFADGRRLCVLPDPEEGRIDHPLPAGVAVGAPPLVARAADGDLGPWLLLAALAVALAEGAVAAAAGRAYGR